MKVRVEYFAQFGQLSGCDNELVETDASTVSALYHQLRRRHGLPEPGPAIRAAVNDEFADWERPLCVGDVIAFLPPVSGG
ncbi:MAG: molybdopterin synthase sulfur carrier subunit [Lysobacteraceae bacterium]|nr:MAG: molybdopterin synthase sulfur carrier subunit [Xanthomonadaceae bacterium]